MMEKIYSCKAVFATDRIPLKELTLDSDWKLVKRESSFLLYQHCDRDRYCYIKDYGAIVYIGLEPQDEQQVWKSIQEANHSTLAENKEELQIVVCNQSAREEGYNEIVVDRLDIHIVHILCINMAQSVALFYYQQISGNLLENTRSYTNQLEQSGRVSLKRKELMKYIGSTLNVKNKISENLFIFDTPMIAWDNEYIHVVDQHINEKLEIKYRYGAIKEQLNIVQENLDLFKDLNLHQHSSNLEWIIIWLILFEVIHVIVDLII